MLKNPRYFRLEKLEEAESARLASLYKENSHLTVLLGTAKNANIESLKRIKEVLQERNEELHSADELNHNLRVNLVIEVENKIKEFEFRRFTGNERIQVSTVLNFKKLIKACM